MTARQILHIPTYIIYSALYPFLPKKHPWKCRPLFSLDEWQRGATPVNDAFAWFFWFGFAYIVVTTITFLLKPW